MKVFVVGANGQIGKHLVDMLNESQEHRVRAMIRKEEQRKHFEKNGIESVVVSLTGSVEEIANAAKGCDAIVFTAGSGGSTGADQTLLIDLDGAVKTIEAAENLGIDRFIMVSAFQANNRDNWNEAIKPYYVAKHYADRALLQSDLLYTIIRPGGLVNEPGTGKVTAVEGADRGYISREDVARTILAALTAENTYRRSFDLVAGDTAISDALREI
ncbi:SDR family oxidoreductase [Peribacillus muralis]|uniref:SDR family oxidoreductase n=1 Tax=Peribacillus muralis TaxID=264697 RepID=UPI003CFBE594